MWEDKLESIVAKWRQSADVRAMLESDPRYIADRATARLIEWYDAGRVAGFVEALRALGVGTEEITAVSVEAGEHCAKLN